MLSTMERMGRAVHSSDLSHGERRTTDADVLGAMGAAGIRHPQGRALLQMDLTMRRADVEDALAETKAIVRDQAKRKGWAALQPKSLVDIARHALEHYTMPVCPKCHGRKLIYAQHQSVTPCQHCNATGKRPLKTRWEREVRAVLAAMEGLRERAICGINQQLGRPAFA